MAELDADASSDEIAIKGVYWTSEVVNSRIEATFVADERVHAGVALAALVGEVPGAHGAASDAATCRLMLAALKLAAGDLVRLALWIEAAHSDPRDLIAAAEYRHQLEEATCDAYEADVAEYVAWVRGEMDAAG